MVLSSFCFKSCQIRSIFLNLIETYCEIYWLLVILGLAEPVKIDVFTLLSASIEVDKVLFVRSISVHFVYGKTIKNKITYDQV